MAFNANYTFNFEPGDLTLSASYVWRDVQDGTIFDRAYDNTPSWDDVDLRALWKAKDDRYEVIGFVKNVFNTLQYEAADEGEGLLGTNATSTTAAAGLVGVNVFNLAPPRTYGRRGALQVLLAPCLAAPGRRFGSGAAGGGVGRCALFVEAQGRHGG